MSTSGMPFIYALCHARNPLTSGSDPQNPLAGRIQQYVERMMRSKTEIFDEASRKRGPPEPTDGLDPVKRQKLGAQINTPAQNRLHVPPLTPGSHTIAELFTVTTDQALRAFDVAQLSEDLVVKIGITILQRINADTLNQAIEVIAVLNRQYLHQLIWIGCPETI
jgi:symplekin